MKKIGRFAILMVLAPSLRADVVSNVGIHSVSSEYTSAPWDLRAIHIVDGSGLSGSPAGHAVTDISGNSWQTISQTGTGVIQFDLGRVCRLATVHVWNLNFSAPYNGRGANQVTIRTSINAGAWNTEGTYTFTQASGAAGDLGFDINSAGWQAARYVEFQILSNFGGADNAGHVGLSEVQFTVAPEPPAITQFTGSGQLTWSNTDTNLFYQVEWASSLTDSNGWQCSYSTLNDISSSNPTVTVSVPMFYRVSGSSHRVVYASPPAKTGQAGADVAGDDGALQKGLAWPNPRFTVQADTNIVLDNLTGLMWARNANLFGGKTTWNDAVSNCNELVIGSCDDWRLPNVRELLTLVDYGGYTPALPAEHPFVGVQSYYYWSSTVYTPSHSRAWCVEMGYGSVTDPYKTDGDCYVWPVRGGK